MVSRYTIGILDERVASVTAKVRAYE